MRCAWAPDDDEAEVTAAQVREVITRLIAAGHWRDGDPPILVIFDAGYDPMRLACLLADLPVEILGRLRSDRVLHFPAPARQPGTNGRPPRHGREFALADPATWPAPPVTTTTRDRPVRHRRRTGLGPAAPPADPPLRLAGPRRPAAGHRGHPDPPAGGSPARRPATPSRCGCGARSPAPRPAEVDRLWQAFLRRFDLEHTFRLFKQVLGWTAPKIRDPAAADRWTWLIITVHAQLRLARPLAGDLRLPWERPAPPGRLTPARVRRGIPEHPRGPALPGRCAETRQTRTRPAARVEEPPPGTPP